MTAITMGLAKSWKYTKTSTTAAIIGSATKSFVLGFKPDQRLQIASPKPWTNDSARLISMMKLTPRGVSL